MTVPPRCKFLLSTVIILVIIMFPNPTSIYSNDVEENTQFPELDDMELIHEEQIYRPSEDIDMGTVNLGIVNSGGAFESNTLFQLYRRSNFDASVTINAVIMDMNGTTIAQKDLGLYGAANCPVEFIDPNTILVGTEWGAALWHLRNDSLQTLGFVSHHDYEYNPNSGTIFTIVYTYVTIEDIGYRFDIIREYTLGGELIWTLHTQDFISTDWWCPSHDMAGSYRDLTHGNTVFYDIEDDIIYYNSRNTNTFFKINHSSSEVLWGLGEYGNFTLYTISGTPKNELWYHCHAVEPIDETSFILLDNNLHRQDGGSAISRILEITIDEDSMTANESWYYNAPSTFYSAGWGDADRLPNGNRIGDFGYLSSTIAFLEVDPAKNVVWKAQFDSDDDYTYGSFNFQRFRFEPILTHHPDIMRKKDVGPISWDAFFNFRNKQPLPGNYTLYLDGVPLESGDFIYEKFWNPTNLTFDIGELTVGIYSVTLAISDGFGNTASDSFELVIQEFNIERTGLTTTEKTQTDLLPTWSGFTGSPLTCNITKNGTLYASFDWNGEDIILDPNTLDLGAHDIHFELFNDTLKLFDDQFWLYVYPAEPPEITPLQSLILETDWSNGVTLSWNLFDATGTYWRIYLDGSVVDSGTWPSTNYIQEWMVPILDDGVYNITLEVEDLQGLVSTSETTFTVLPPVSPHIVDSPGDMILVWGTENTSFVWEVTGGFTWIVYKDCEELASGDVNGDFIQIAIDDWQAEDWRPGEHNLTLVLYRDEQSVSDTSWITILLDKGDPYADAIVVSRSQFYRSNATHNAIGAPDGAYATIFLDYENGFITLDMGEDEEIVDGTGVDFTIYAQGDEYRVLVSDSLITTFELLGHFTGNTSLDLSSIPFDMVRYVRIELYSGEECKIDAIEAINYNIPLSDTDPPIIEPLEDVSMYLRDKSVFLNWTAFDATPWNYEVYVNSTLVESGWWYGSEVCFNFTPEAAGLWNVTILFRDAFDNIAVSQVWVEVRTASSPNIFVIVIVAIAGIGSLVVIVVYLKKIKS